MFRLLFLGIGWADCVEIWYTLGNQLATAYAVVTDGVFLHVRTCAPRFCISQTARPIVFKFGVWVSTFESLPKCFPQVMGWVSLHVRTCRPRFCISGTAWPIEFNFGVSWGS